VATPLAKVAFGSGVAYSLDFQGIGFYFYISMPHTINAAQSPHGCS
jgi:hypothetical protein